VAQVYTVSVTGGNLNYAWLNGLSTIKTMSTSIAGTYFVTVTGSCGSPQISNTITLNLYNCTSINTTPGTSTGISQSVTGDNVSAIYPNPNNGSFIIEISILENYAITSVEGKSTYNRDFNHRQNIIETNLSKGVYFVRIDGKVRKLIIE
jgi:hypothetical protein